MPSIVYQDSYLTIWSLSGDTIVQDHFDKMGFHKDFACDCSDIARAAKIENPGLPKGTLYKFKRVSTFCDASSFHAPEIGILA